MAGASRGEHPRMPARGVGCNVMPDSFQFRVIAKNMIVKTAMPEMVIVCRPFRLVHAVPISGMDRRFEPANDTSRRRSPAGDRRGDPGPHDTVYMIWHHHKFIDRDIGETVGNRPPAVIGERTRR